MENSEVKSVSSIEIRTDVPKEKWDEFLKACDFRYFLQTYEWADFEEKGMGKKVWRLGFYEENKLVGVCIAYEEKTRFGNFIYCPRGPVFDWKNYRLRGIIVDKLIDYFGNKNGVLDAEEGSKYAFIRIDPAVTEDNIDINKELLRKGFDDAVGFVQVERAWIVDVAERKDDDLLKEMRKNTRYYIRRAEREGVKIRISDDSKDLEIFISMIQDMAKRKNFPVFPPEYFRKQFQNLNPSNMQKVFVAEYNGNPVATALITFYGNEGSYLHAASSEENGDLQAPYLLQWEALKYARENGYKKYNFWGVVSDKNYHPGHPSYGYSLFKKGFGGHLEVYMRTKDFAYNHLKYSLYRWKEVYSNWRYNKNF